MHQYTGFGTRSTYTPQTQPIPGREAEMSPNNAGGVSFVVDDMTRFQRFAILGSSAGTFYVNSQKLTRENLTALENLLKAGRGTEVVAKIVEISDAGRAVSNDPALFALSRCCAADDTETRRAAYDALPNVARTGTHLLHFMEYVKQFRGRGRAHRRAIRAWYEDKTVEKLAYQLLKYQNRDGWSQRDILRLARPKAGDNQHNWLYHWSVKGHEAEVFDPNMVPEDRGLALIWAYELAKRATDDKEVARLIKEYRLPREAILTEHLKSIRVWEALLEDMPLEAMTRNLATMTRNGVLVPMGSFTQSVAARLRSRDAIHKARLHPIKLLAALTTYESGKSVRGSATWTPLREIVDALNDAFYLSFECVEPTEKRILLAIDVSGSMHGTLVNGIPGVQCHAAASAMAMVTAKSAWHESGTGMSIPNYHVIGYDTAPHALSISHGQRLDDVVRMVQSAGGGGTDCAVPMQWALQQRIQVDAFVCYSDSETWAGRAQPMQMLKQYREQMNPQARMVNVQMTATHVTNNAPDDGLALECVGFDTSTAQVINAFINGEI